MKRNFWKITGLFCALIFWQITALAIPLWPSLPEVYQTLATNWERFVSASLATGWRVAIGVLIGYSLGMATAIVSERFFQFRWLVYLPIEIVRPIPPIALTPFFIVILGITNFAQIMLITLGVFMMTYIGYSEALDKVPLNIRRSAKTLGFSGFQYILRVSLPAAWPGQIGLIRIILAFSLGLSVAAEFLGSQNGLGYLIRNARTLLQLETVVVCCLALALLAVLFDRAVVYFHRKTSTWDIRRETL